MLSPNQPLQLLEKFRFAREAILLAQPGQCLLNQRHGPAMLERSIRVRFSGWFCEITILGLRRVDRENLQTAATLQTPGPLPLVHDEILERSEQESAKLAAIT